MNPDESRLVRHLALAVALKVAVLAALWWGFVRDGRVDVDAPRAATHIAAPSPSNGEKP